MLQHIVEAGHGVMGLVTPPERANNAEIVETCMEFGIELFAVKNVNDQYFLNRWSCETRPRIGIIAGYSTIFRQPLIELPELGTINLHAGRLPQYRGGSPLNWQIIQGEKNASVSVIRVDRGIDTGNVLAEANIDIAPDHNIGDVHDEANRLFPLLVNEVLYELDMGTLQEREQSEEHACYWHQRNDDDGRIFWHRFSAQQVHDLVRAVTHPYPGASCYLGGKKIRVFRTRIPQETIRGVPGRVCWWQGRGPYVICADRAILLEEYAIGKGNDNREGCLRHGSHLD